MFLQRLWKSGVQSAGYFENCEELSGVSANGLGVLLPFKGKHRRFIVKNNRRSADILLWFAFW